jgi:16S rRNA (adenine1518-N6/adenine1519-N6)-dimethyltransferase
MSLPKKQLGQHWLSDKLVLNSIVDSADIKPGETVLEIGPGLGTLTQVLINRFADVTAIELDESLASQLESRVIDKDSKLTIKTGDIMRFNLSELPKDYKIVANIPYYLTSGLIRLLGEAANPPSLAVLLVQKEVAERVCARPGAMSILSVTTQMYFEVALGMVVPAKMFTPPPKVDSQVIILKKRDLALFGDQDPKALFKVVKAGFSERRKKLRSSLSGGLQITKGQADLLLKLADISGDLRAQNLSLDDWLTIAKSCAVG